jgi:hypothetical protein
VPTKPSNRVSTFCTKSKTEIFCQVAGPGNIQKSSVACTRAVQGTGRGRTRVLRVDWVALDLLHRPALEFWSRAP